ncbi:hypothetical protein COOONC_05832 [Cooperia oncophora]
MLSMPRLKSGCTMLTIVDERGCPMPKIVCSKENLKCGSIYCEPGYECDHDTTTCIPRRDCPGLVLPKQEGCTDRMRMKNVYIVTHSNCISFSVHAGPFDCDKDGKCAPGLRCEDGACVLRTDCPMLSMPRLKSGCTMLTIVDERGCPMPKIVCSKENLKCGSIYCEPGYECDHDTTTLFQEETALAYTTASFLFVLASLLNLCARDEKPPQLQHEHLVGIQQIRDLID